MFKLRCWGGILLVLLSGCAAPGNLPASDTNTPQAASPAFSPSPNPPTAPSPLPSASLSPTATASLLPTASFTPTASETSTPSQTPAPSETFTPSPTAGPLHGVVNVEKVSCRYGPGAMYLYVYGLVQGARQELIGRNETASWVLTRARGSNTSCWVKTDLMNLDGDPLALPLIVADDYRLPQSPYYPPLTGVSAARNGSVVTVSWNPLVLRAGDDSLQTPYVLQVWVCQGGQPVMESIGSYETSANVTDEGGCGIASRGRVAAAEKHGYTTFVEIPWP